MIQYYHYHTNGSYTDVFSEANKQDLLPVMEELASLKRARATCFSYVPINGMGYFTQTSTLSYDFVHVMMGDFAEIRFEPSRYMSSVSATYNEAGPKPVNKPLLPSDELELSSYLTERLRPFFAPIVDSVLYGKQPIVLCAQKEETLKLCIMAVYKLLPMEVALRTGFTVAPSELPDYLGNSNNIVGKNLRICGVTKIYDSLDGFKVFNIDGDAPIVDDLHAYSRAINCMLELQSFNNREAGMLTNSARVAVSSDGTVNQGKLEGAALLKMFDSYRIYNSGDRFHSYTARINAVAREIVANATEYDFDVNQLTEVTFTLMDMDTVLSEDSRKIIDMARLNEGVAANTLSRYGKMLFEDDLLTQGHALSKEQTDCVCDYLNSLSDEDLQACSDKLSMLEGDFKRDHGKQILSILNNAYCKGRSLAVLKLLFKFVDIRYTYNLDIRGNRDAFSDAIFEGVNSLPQSNEKNVLLATYVMSCFTVDEKEYFKERINSFKRFVVAAYPEVKKQINFLLGMRMSFDKLRRVLEDIKSKHIASFPSEEWSDELVAALSFSECIELAMERGRDVRLSSYELINSKVKDRLCNIEEIKANVTLDINYNEYNEYLNSGARIQDEEYIRQYIGSLNSTRDGFGDLDRFRTEYIRHSFATMSDKIKNDICADVNKEPTEQSYREITDTLARNDANLTEQKQNIAQSVIDRHLKTYPQGVAIKPPTLAGKYMILAGLLTLLYMLLSAVILSLPHVVYAITLHLDVMSRILDNVPFYAVAVILYTGALHILAYLFKLRKENNDWYAALSYASKCALLFAIIPIFFYAVGYAVVYVVPGLI